MEKQILNFVSAIGSGQLTKVDASEFLGISRPTLDKRIELLNFTKAEKALIKTKY